MNKTWLTRLEVFQLTLRKSNSTNCNILAGIVDDGAYKPGPDEGRGGAGGYSGGGAAGGYSGGNNL